MPSAEAVQSNDAEAPHMPARGRTVEQSKRQAKKNRPAPTPAQRRELRRIGRRALWAGFIGVLSIGYVEIDPLADRD